ncbi:MAG: hypothetical protein KAI72_08020, partial [Candidatus Pacebacteria bacterium]|nr:hypothetical protein [Candidatus Paceibacterota bacterium]
MLRARVNEGLAAALKELRVAQAQYRNVTGVEKNAFVTTGVTLDNYNLEIEIEKVSENIQEFTDVSQLDARALQSRDMRFGEGERTFLRHINLTLGIGLSLENDASSMPISFGLMLRLWATDDKYHNQALRKEFEKFKLKQTKYYKQLEQKLKSSSLRVKKSKELRQFHQNTAAQIYKDVFGREINASGIFVDGLANMLTAFASGNLSWENIDFFIRILNNQSIGYASASDNYFQHALELRQFNQLNEDIEHTPEELAANWKAQREKQPGFFTRLWRSIISSEEVKKELTQTEKPQSADNAQAKQEKEAPKFPSKRDAVKTQTPQDKFNQAVSRLSLLSERINKVDVALPSAASEQASWNFKNIYTAEIVPLLQESFKQWRQMRDQDSKENGLLEIKEVMILINENIITRILKIEDIHDRIAALQYFAQKVDILPDDFSNIVKDLKTQASRLSQAEQEQINHKIKLLKAKREFYVKARINILSQKIIKDELLLDIEGKEVVLKRLMAEAMQNNYYEQKQHQKMLKQVAEIKQGYTKKQQEWKDFYEQEIKELIETNDSVVIKLHLASIKKKFFNQYVNYFTHKDIPDLVEQLIRAAEKAELALRIKAKAQNEYNLNYIRWEQALQQAESVEKVVRISNEVDRKSEAYVNNYCDQDDQKSLRKDILVLKNIAAKRVEIILGEKGNKNPEEINKNVSMAMPVLFHEKSNFSQRIKSLGFLQKIISKSIIEGKSSWPEHKAFLIEKIKALPRTESVKQELLGVLDLFADVLETVKNTNSGQKPANEAARELNNIAEHKLAAIKVTPQGKRQILIQLLKTVPGYESNISQVTIDGLLEALEVLLMPQQSHGPSSLISLWQAAQQESIDAQIEQLNIEQAQLMYKSLKQDNFNIDVGLMLLMPYLKIEFLNNSDFAEYAAEAMVDFNQIKKDIINKNLRLTTLAAYLNYIYLKSQENQLTQYQQAVQESITQLQTTVGWHDQDLQKLQEEYRNLAIERIKLAADIQEALNHLPEEFSQAQPSVQAMEAFTQELLSSKPFAELQNAELEFYNLLVLIRDYNLQATIEHKQPVNIYVTQPIMTAVMNLFPWIFKLFSEADPNLLRQQEYALDQSVVDLAKYGIWKQNTQIAALKRYRQLQTQFEQAQSNYTKAKAEQARSVRASLKQGLKLKRDLTQARIKLNQAKRQLEFARLEMQFIGADSGKAGQFSQDKAPSIKDDSALADTTTYSQTQSFSADSAVKIIHQGNSMILVTQRLEQSFKSDNPKSVYLGKEEGYLHSVEMNFSGTVEDGDLSMQGWREIPLGWDKDKQTITSSIKYAMDVNLNEIDTQDICGAPEIYSGTFSVQYNKQLTKDITAKIPQFAVTIEPDGSRRYLFGVGISSAEHGVGIETGIIVDEQENKISYWVGGHKRFEWDSGHVASFALYFADSKIIVEPSVLFKTENYGNFSLDQQFRQDFSGEQDFEYRIRMEWQTGTWSIGTGAEWSDERLVPVFDIGKKNLLGFKTIKVQTKFNEEGPSTTAQLNKDLTKQINSHAEFTLGADSDLDWSTGATHTSGGAKRSIGFEVAGSESSDQDFTADARMKIRSGKFDSQISGPITGEGNVSATVGLSNFELSENAVGSFSATGNEKGSTGLSLRFAPASTSAGKPPANFVADLLSGNSSSSGNLGASDFNAGLINSSAGTNPSQITTSTGQGTTTLNSTSATTITQTTTNTDSLPTLTILTQTQQSSNRITPQLSDFDENINDLKKYLPVEEQQALDNYLSIGGQKIPDIVQTLNTALEGFENMLAQRTSLILAGKQARDAAIAELGPILINIARINTKLLEAEDAITDLNQKLAQYQNAYSQGRKQAQDWFNQQGVDSLASLLRQKGKAIVDLINQINIAVAQVRLNYEQTETDAQDLRGNYADTEQTMQAAMDAGNTSWGKLDVQVNDQVSSYLSKIAKAEQERQAGNQDPDLLNEYERSRLSTLVQSVYITNQQHWQVYWEELILTGEITFEEVEQDLIAWKWLINNTYLNIEMHGQSGQEIDLNQQADFLSLVYWGVTSQVMGRNWVKTEIENRLRIVKNVAALFGDSQFDPTDKDQVKVLRFFIGMSAFGNISSPEVSNLLNYAVLYRADIESLTGVCDIIDPASEGMFKLMHWAQQAKSLKESENKDPAVIFDLLKLIEPLWTAIKGEVDFSRPDSFDPEIMRYVLMVESKGYSQQFIQKMLSAYPEILKGIKLLLGGGGPLPDAEEYFAIYFGVIAANFEEDIDFTTLFERLNIVKTKIEQTTGLTEQLFGAAEIDLSNQDHLDLLMFFALHLGDPELDSVLAVDLPVYMGKLKAAIENNYLAGWSLDILNNEADRDMLYYWTVVASKLSESSVDAKIAKVIDALQNISAILNQAAALTGQSYDLDSLKQLRLNDGSFLGQQGLLFLTNEYTPEQQLQLIDRAVALDFILRPIFSDIQLSDNAMNNQAYADYLFKWAAAEVLGRQKDVTWNVELIVQVSQLVKSKLLLGVDITIADIDTQVMNAIEYLAQIIMQQDTISAEVFVENFARLTQEDVDWNWIKQGIKPDWKEEQERKIISYMALKAEMLGIDRLIRILNGIGESKDDLAGLLNHQFSDDLTNLNDGELDLLFNEAAIDLAIYTPEQISKSNQIKEILEQIYDQQLSVTEHRDIIFSWLDAEGQGEFDALSYLEEMALLSTQFRQTFGEIDTQYKLLLLDKLTYLKLNAGNEFSSTNIMEEVIVNLGQLAEKGNWDWLSAELTPTLEYTEFSDIVLQFSLAAHIMSIDSIEEILKIMTQIKPSLEKAEDRTLSPLQNREDFNLLYQEALLIAYNSGSVELAAQEKIEQLETVGEIADELTVIAQESESFEDSVLNLHNPEHRAFILQAAAYEIENIGSTGVMAEILPVVRTELFDGRRLELTNADSPDWVPLREMANLKTQQVSNEEIIQVIVTAGMIMNVVNDTLEQTKIQDSGSIIIMSALSPETEAAVISHPESALDVTNVDDIQQLITIAQKENVQELAASEDLITIVELWLASELFTTFYNTPDPLTAPGGFWDWIYFISDVVDKNYSGTSEEKAAGYLEDIGRVNDMLIADDRDPVHPLRQLFNNGNAIEHSWDLEVEGEFLVGRTMDLLLDLAQGIWSENHQTGIKINDDTGAVEEFYLKEGIDTPELTIDNLYRQYQIVHATVEGGLNPLQIISEINDIDTIVFYDSNDPDNEESKLLRAVVNTLADGVSSVLHRSAPGVNIDSWEPGFKILTSADNVVDHLLRQKKLVDIPGALDVISQLYDINTIKYRGDAENSPKLRTVLAELAEGIYSELHKIGLKLDIDCGKSSFYSLAPNNNAQVLADRLKNALDLLQNGYITKIAKLIGLEGVPFRGDAKKEAGFDVGKSAVLRAYVMSLVNDIQNATVYEVDIDSGKLIKKTNVPEDEQLILAKLKQSIDNADLLGTEYVNKMAKLIGLEGVLFRGDYKKEAGADVSKSGILRAYVMGLVNDINNATLYEVNIDNGKLTQKTNVPADEQLTLAKLKQNIDNALDLEETGYVDKMA